MFFASERWIMVEELLGQDLLQVTKDGGISTDLLRAVSLGVLRGLQTLHAINVIHCDIKPDNVAWAPRAGCWKLLDFGHARLQVDPWFAYREQGACHVGHRSPECLLGLPVDTKSDVWGLGITLCETWGGKLLWEDGEQICDMCAKLDGLVGPVPNDVAQLCPFRQALFTFVDGKPRAVRPNAAPVGRLTHALLEPTVRFDDIFSGAPDDLIAFVRRLLNPVVRTRSTAEEMLLDPFVCDASGCVPPPEKRFGLDGDDDWMGAGF